MTQINLNSGLTTQNKSDAHQPLIPGFRQTYFVSFSHKPNLSS